MAHRIDKDEVLKVARLSYVLVYEHEISDVIKQLDSVLSYAARVNQVEQYDFKKEMHAGIAENRVRKDVVNQVDPAEVLNQVPVRDGSLIIVPMILETV